MADILDINDQTKRETATKALLQTGDTAKICSLITACTDEGNVKVANAKEILHHINEFASDVDDEKLAKTIVEDIINKIGRRYAAYGNESIRAREVLADIFEGSNKLKDCIHVLKQIPTDLPGLRSEKEEYRASLLVRLAQISMKVDEETQAGEYVKKARPLMRHVTDPEMKLHFETCYAHISDVTKNFLEAGNRYYALSHRLESGLPALQKAILCCVMSPAGPQRSRLLAQLVKDERVASLGELSGILNKLYYSRILREGDVKIIDPLLKPHHKGTRADGRTHFDHAVQQHNLLSASKLYDNIRFTELGSLLGLAPHVAEKLAAGMIAEDRLKASIDQVDQLIIFLSDPSAPLLKWDEQIASVCHGLAQVTDEVIKKHAKYSAMLQ